MAAACVALSAVGMTTPSCQLGVPSTDGLDGALVFLERKGAYALVCQNEADPDTCLDFAREVCSDMRRVDWNWREVVAVGGLTLVPNSYAQVIECAEPEKDTQ